MEAVERMQNKNPKHKYKTCKVIHNGSYLKLKALKQWKREIKETFHSLECETFFFNFPSSVHAVHRLSVSY